MLSVRDESQALRLRHREPFAGFGGPDRTWPRFHPGRRALVVDRQQAADALADRKVERGRVQVRASIAESEGCHCATRPN